MDREPIFIGDDYYAQFDGANDTADGTFLDSGTCTYELFDSAGASVTTGTCDYVVGSDGDYRGVIESTVTDTLTLGANYLLVITFAQSAFNTRRRIYLRACYHEG